MDEKLKLLYESYIKNGLLSSKTTFEQFANADEGVKKSLYDLGVKNKAISSATTPDVFNSAWGETKGVVSDVKKKPQQKEIETPERGVLEDLSKRSTADAYQNYPTPGESTSVSVDTESGSLRTDGYNPQETQATPYEVGGGRVGSYDFKDGESITADSDIATGMSQEERDERFKKIAKSDLDLIYKGQKYKDEKARLEQKLIAETDPKKRERIEKSIRVLKIKPGLESGYLEGTETPEKVKALKKYVKDFETSEAKRKGLAYLPEDLDRRATSEQLKSTLTEDVLKPIEESEKLGDYKSAIKQTESVLKNLDDSWATPDLVAAKNTLKDKIQEYKNISGEVSLPTEELKKEKDVLYEFGKDIAFAEGDWTSLNLGLDEDAKENQDLASQAYDHYLKVNRQIEQNKKINKTIQDLGVKRKDYPEYVQTKAAFDGYVDNLKEKIKGLDPVKDKAEIEKIAKEGEDAYGERLEFTKTGGLMGFDDYVKVTSKYKGDIQKDVDKMLDEYLTDDEKKVRELVKQQAELDPNDKEGYEELEKQINKLRFDDEFYSLRGIEAIYKGDLNSLVRESLLDQSGKIKGQKENEKIPPSIRPLVDEFVVSYKGSDLGSLLKRRDELYEEMNFIKDELYGGKYTDRDDTYFGISSLAGGGRTRKGTFAKGGVSEQQNIRARDEYLQKWAEFYAISKEIALNEDPASINKGIANGLIVFGNSFAKSFVSPSDRVTADLSTTDRELLSNYASGLESSGLLTEDQIEKAKQNFGEKLASGLGTTAKIAIDFMMMEAATAGTAGYGGFIANAARLKKLLGNTKVGNLTIDLLANKHTYSGIKFDLAGQNFSTGVGESLGESAWDKFIRNSPGPKWLRVLSGKLFQATGMTVGEYTGEFVDALSREGSPYEAFAQTIGEDPWEKLAITYIMSGAFGLAVPLDTKTDMERELLGYKGDNELINEIKEQIKNEKNAFGDWKNSVKGGFEDITGYSLGDTRDVTMPGFQAKATIAAVESGELELPESIAEAGEILGMVDGKLSETQATRVQKDIEGVLADEKVSDEVKSELQEFSNLIGPTLITSETKSDVDTELETPGQDYVEIKGSVGSSLGKKVVFDGKEGVLKQEEDGTIIVETKDQIIEIPNTQKDLSKTLEEVGVEAVKEKPKVTGENKVEVDGNELEITNVTTDENGNVTSYGVKNEDGTTSVIDNPQTVEQIEIEQLKESADPEAVSEELNNMAIAEVVEMDEKIEAIDDKLDRGENLNETELLDAYEWAEESKNKANESDLDQANKEEIVGALDTFQEKLIENERKQQQPAIETKLEAERQTKTRTTGKATTEGVVEEKQEEVTDAVQKRESEEVDVGEQTTDGTGVVKERKPEEVTEEVQEEVDFDVSDDYVAWALDYHKKALAKAKKSNSRWGIEYNTGRIKEIEENPLAELEDKKKSLEENIETNLDEKYAYLDEELLEQINNQIARLKGEAAPEGTSIKKQNVSDLNKLSKKAKTREKKQVLRTVKNVVKAMIKIAPDVEVVVHENEKSYEAAVLKGGGSITDRGTRGFFDNGNQIHINLEAAKTNTALHEGSHMVMASYMKRNPKAVDKFYTELRKILSTSSADKLRSFSSSYVNPKAVRADGTIDFSQLTEEEIKTYKDEFITEALAMISDGEIELTPTIARQIKQLLETIMKAIGMNPKELNLTGRENVQEFSEKLHKAFKTGEALTMDGDTKTTVDAAKPETIKKQNLKFQADYSDPVSKMTFVYDKNGNKFKKLEKDGHIKRGGSLSDFDGKIIFLHQPDAAFSGSIYKNNELLVEGKGGVFYPIKFHEDGYFWASTDRAANKMANDLNQVLEENGGTIYMALTTAPPDKLLSSTTMSNAVLDFFSSKSADKNFKITPNQLKVRLRKAANDVKVKDGKKIGLDLKLPSNLSLEEIQSKIKEALGADKSTFPNRKNFTEELVSLMAEKIKNDPVAIQQFGELFSEGIQNKYFKGITKRGKLSISKANMTQALSEMFTEPMLKEGVDRESSGQVYAIMELNGRVKPVKSDKHESYPMAIESVDKKNKVTVHLLKDRLFWGDVFEDPTTNEIVEKSRHKKVYPTMTGVSTKGLKLNTGKTKPKFQKGEVKKGVSEVFESTPELKEIGTEKQYSEYLDSAVDNPSSILTFSTKRKIDDEKGLNKLLNLKDTTIRGAGEVTRGDKKEIRVYDENIKYGDKSRSFGFNTDYEINNYLVVVNTKNKRTYTSSSSNLENSAEILNKYNIPPEATEDVLILNELREELKRALASKSAAVKETHSKKRQDLQQYKEGVFKRFKEITPQNVNIILNEIGVVKEVKPYYLIKNSKDILVLGSKQDIKGFKEFVSQAPKVEPKFQKGEVKKAVKFQNPSKQIWTSSAVRGVENVTQKSATLDQWIKMITDKGGKGTSQELQWLGLSDFLQEYQKTNKVKSIPKAVVQNYIDDNQLNVEEVVKGRETLLSGLNTDSKYATPRVITIMKRHQGSAPDALEMAIENDFDAMEELKNKFGDEVWEEDFTEKVISDIAGESLIPTGQTKYETWVLPGGENYQEVLFTIPPKPATQFKVGNKVETPNGETGRVVEVRTAEDLKPYVVELDNGKIQYYHQDQIKGGVRTGDYQSSHWDESNILAHVRMNERTLPNGEEVLFIEEVQSDWAQEGKKKGFSKNTLPGGFELKEMKGGGWRVWNITDNTVVAEENTREETINSFNKDYQRNVPDMPYKKTDQWVGMAIRRIMKIASDQGFDRIAWVTGDQSADRYNMTNVVKEIIYFETIMVDENTGLEIPNKGVYDVTVLDKNNRSIISEHMDAEKIEATLGKEIAKKIEDTKKGELKGDGLKIGGEGMRTFYNSILPKVATKEAKRFDKNAKVEVVKFKKEYDLDDIEGTKGSIGSQLSIAITPKIKEATSKGVPKFQKAEPKKLLAPNGKPSNLNEVQHKAVRTPEFKRWFGDWENDPENASKVVDENGEPLVMYHGTKNEFNVFSNVMAGSNTTRNLQRNQWFWFADNKDIAESYGSARILPVFLNVRNPEIAEKSLTKTYEKASKKSLKDGIIGEDLPDTRYETRTILVDGSSWWVDRKGMSGSVAEEIERKTETDELIFLLDDTLSYWKDELESMQIDVDKLSKLKGQEFDDAIEAIDPYYHDPIMAAKAIKVLEKGGVEALRITDPLKGIIVAAKESNQIKLADGTNRTFDPTSKDIRFQKFDERTSREGARRPVRGVAPSKAAYVNQMTSLYMQQNPDANRSETKEYFESEYDRVGKPKFQKPERGKPYTLRIGDEEIVFKRTDPDTGEPTSVELGDGWPYVRLSDGTYTDGDLLFESWDQFQILGRGEFIDEYTKEMTPEREAEVRNRPSVKEYENEGTLHRLTPVFFWNRASNFIANRLGYDTILEAQDTKGVDDKIIAGLTAKAMKLWENGEIKKEEDFEKVFQKPKFQKPDKYDKKTLKTYMAKEYAAAIDMGMTQDDAMFSILGNTYEMGVDAKLVEELFNEFSDVIKEAERVKKIGEKVEKKKTVEGKEITLVRESWRKVRDDVNNIMKAKREGRRSEREAMKAVRQKLDDFLKSNKNTIKNVKLTRTLLKRVSNVTEKNIGKLMDDIIESTVNAQKKINVKNARVAQKKIKKAYKKVPKELKSLGDRLMAITPTYDSDIPAFNPDTLNQMVNDYLKLIKKIEGSAEILNRDTPSLVEIEQEIQRIRNEKMNKSAKKSWDKMSAEEKAEYNNDFDSFKDALYATSPREAGESMAGKKRKNLILAIKWRLRRLESYMEDLPDGVVDDAKKKQTLDVFNNIYTEGMTLTLWNDMSSEMKNDRYDNDFDKFQEEYAKNRVKVEDLENTEMVELGNVLNEIMVFDSYNQVGTIETLIAGKRKGRRVGNRIKNKLKASRIALGSIKNLTSLGNFFKAIAGGEGGKKLRYEMLGEVDRQGSIANKKSDRFNAALDKKYDKLGKGKKRKKSFTKMGIASYLVQNEVGMSDAEMNQDFLAKKKLIELQIEKARDIAKRKTTETSKKRGLNELADMQEEIYNEFFRDAKSKDEALEKLNSAERDIYDFIKNEFEKTKEPLIDNHNRFNGKDLIEFDNYIPTVQRPVDNFAEFDVDDGSLDNTPSGSVNVDQSGTTIKRVQIPTKDANGNLKSDEELENVNLTSIHVFDINTIAKQKMKEVLYDIHTLRDRKILKAMLNSPEMKNALGDNLHREILTRIGRKIGTQKGTFFDGINKYSGIVRALFKSMRYLRAVKLKTIDQYIKQPGSIMVHTIGAVGVRPFMSSMKIMTELAVNKKSRDAFNKLISQSEIANRVTEGEYVIQDQNSLVMKAIKASGGDKALLTKHMAKIYEEVFDKALTNGDNFATRMSWLSSYMKELKRKGKIKNYSDFNLEDASENIDLEALSFADSQSQDINNYSDFSEAPEVLTNMDKTAQRELLYNFKSFSMNMWVRNAIAIRDLINSGGVEVNKGQSISYIASSMSAVVAFAAIKQFIVNPLYDELIAYLFGIESDDEDLKEKLIKVGLDAAADYLVGGAPGGAVTESGFKKAVNFMNEKYIEATGGKFNARKDNIFYERLQIPGSYSMPLEEADSFIGILPELYKGEKLTKSQKLDLGASLAAIMGEGSIDRLLSKASSASRRKDKKKSKSSSTKLRGSRSGTNARKQYKR